MKKHKNERKEEEMKKEKLLCFIAFSCSLNCSHIHLFMNEREKYVFNKLRQYSSMAYQTYGVNLFYSFICFLICCGVLWYLRDLGVVTVGIKWKAFSDSSNFWCSGWM
jgi:hypothetical protein